MYYVTEFFNPISNFLTYVCFCSGGLRLLRLLDDIDFTRAKQQNTLLHVLYSDKTLVLDRSERVQGPFYIIKSHTLREYLLEGFAIQVFSD